MSSVLLDANVLVALAVDDHVHHEAAVSWFLDGTSPFATTPITQGTLLRLLLRSGMATETAFEVLSGFTQHLRHRFWADDRPYEASTLRGVVGHRQVTDAYLASLARGNEGRLATFDHGLAALHPDVAELVATGE